MHKHFYGKCGTKFQKMLVRTRKRSGFYTVVSITMESAQLSPPFLSMFRRLTISKRWAGIGIVVVDVDRSTGDATTARILRSTGCRVLDEAALNAFRQRRFRPDTVSHVRIPIRFLMRGVVPVVYE